MCSRITASQQKDSWSFMWTRQKATHIIIQPDRRRSIFFFLQFWMLPINPAYDRTFLALNAGICSFCLYFPLLAAEIYRKLIYSSNLAAKMLPGSEDIKRRPLKPLSFPKNLGSKLGGYLCYCRPLLACITFLLRPQERGKIKNISMKHELPARV